MRLSTILDPSCIVLDVGAGTKSEILARIAAPMLSLRPDLDAQAVVAELVRREQESSTAIADGIAIPHARPHGHAQVTAGIGRSPGGIEFDSLDGRPTTLLVVLLSPPEDPAVHVAWLAHVARLLGDPAVRRKLLEAGSRAEILSAIELREREFEEDDHGTAKDCR